MDKSLDDHYALMRDQTFIRRCFGNAACLLTVALVRELEDFLPINCICLYGQLWLTPVLTFPVRPKDYLHGCVNDVSLSHRDVATVRWLVMTRVLSGHQTILMVEHDTGLFVYTLDDGTRVPVYIFMHR